MTIDTHEYIINTFMLETSMYRSPPRRYIPHCANEDLKPLRARADVAFSDFPAEFVLT